MGKTRKKSAPRNEKSREVRLKQQLNKKRLQIPKGIRHHNVEQLIELIDEFGD